MSNAKNRDALTRMPQPVPVDEAAKPDTAPIDLGHVVEELVAARRWLRTVIDHMPAMVGYWDRDLRNRLANRAYREWFGRDPAEMAGMHIRDLLGPDLFALNRPYIRAALRGVAQQFDREITDPAGNLRHSQAHYIPDITEKGEVVGFFVLVADITERVRAERALKAEYERTDALSRRLRVVSHVSASVQRLDPEQVQAVVTDAVAQLGYEGSCLAVLTGATTFMPVHGRGPFEAFNGRTLPLPGSSTEAALRQDGALVVPDYQTSPWATSEGTSTGVRTIVATPVRGEGTVFGVLHAGHLTQREIFNEDIEALTLLAHMAGVAMANAQRHALLKQQSDVDAHEARTDALTGVGNRRQADELLAHARPGDVLVIADLDHFKRINDTYGHQVGDQVIRAFTDHLRVSLRDRDQIARIGGEEFLVLLPATGVSRATETFERIRRTWHSAPAHTTFSAGLARVDLTESPQRTLERCDQALYTAKNAGRDRITTCAD